MRTSGNGFKLTIEHSVQVGSWGFMGIHEFCNEKDIGGQAYQYAIIWECYVAVSPQSSRYHLAKPQPRARTGSAESAETGLVSGWN